MPLSYSASVRMLMKRRRSSTARPQPLTLGAPFGAMSDAITLVSTSQPITARGPDQDRGRVSNPGLRHRGFPGIERRNDRRVGWQQSFEFGGVDDCDRLLAAHGDVLGSVVMGAPDDFTEFRLRLFQLPDCGACDKWARLGVGLLRRSSFRRDDFFAVLRRMHARRFCFLSLGRYGLSRRSLFSRHRSVLLTS